MQHFPIFVALKGQRVVVSGAGETAVAKLRLLLKTDARIAVYGADPTHQIREWAAQGKLHLSPRAIETGDATCARLLYAANDDAAEDARAADIGRAAGALVNIVDNLHDSQFITPAIVDRDPVTVAIGTEGAAPVLARKIKADIEAHLPTSLGLLTRVGQRFRRAAEALPMGRVRRDFWSAFYFRDGPKALAQGGAAAAQEALDSLLDDHLNARRAKGSVALVGAGPGDPDLLTRKAQKLLHDADVVIHDSLVGAGVLELARREALLIETGKRGFGPSWHQDSINAEMIRHAAQGAQVVRLKGGDPVIFGRLDEEIEALDAVGIDWQIVPGITAASAAAAHIGQSLTKRGRNSDLRFFTAHDVQGFADQDWRTLARPGAVAAVYMGKRAARFVSGRLLMHGADAALPVTIVENASLADQAILDTTLSALPDLMDTATHDGPAVILLGLAPRAARGAIQDIDHLEEFA